MLRGYEPDETDSVPKSKKKASVIQFSLMVMMGGKGRGSEKDCAAWHDSHREEKKAMEKLT